MTAELPVVGQEPGHQSTRFLVLYALAVSGGAVAYMPFLTILLPLKVQAMPGRQAVDLLALLAFVGAIAASFGNIAFGWLSDRTRTRQAWIWAGLLLSCGLLLLLSRVSNPVLLVLIIALWQLALNMMLGPLAAWAGDAVPDRQKGLLGGLLAAAPACGAAAGMAVTLLGPDQPFWRFAVVVLITLAAVLPVLVFGRPAPMPELLAEPSGARLLATNLHPARRMWTARLLVQIAEASLFAFLLVWLRSLDSSLAEHDVARIFTAVLSAAVLIAVGVGRWSDRIDRPILPLAVCAMVAALGLVMMAQADGLGLALTGYAGFGLASSVLLALHSSQTLRVLPSARHRGRDLGLFNLTNTVPSLVMPWLIVGLVPAYGFGALFLVLAGLAVVAGVILLSITPSAADRV